jgi:serine/threonine protein kinase
MPLPAGDRLGPYEILTPIGSGGMGDVYKARDSRLNRTVAIKVSAAQFSVRFEREAHAITALNHPHICQVYDVGPNYLVMEYVEEHLQHQRPQQPLRRNRLPPVLVVQQIEPSVERFSMPRPSLHGSAVMDDLCAPVPPTIHIQKVHAVFGLLRAYGEDDLKCFLDTFRRSFSVAC